MFKIKLFVVLSFSFRLNTQKYYLICNSALSKSDEYYIFLYFKNIYIVLYLFVYIFTRLFFERFLLTKDIIKNYIIITFHVLYFFLYNYQWLQFYVLICSIKLIEVLSISRNATNVFQLRNRLFV